MRFIKIFGIVFCILLSVLEINGQDRTAGLIEYDSLSYNGYTLFSPMTTSETYLIDNCGREIKTWTFSSTPGLLAYLGEDGTIYRAGSSGVFGAGGSGGRIVRKGWDDNEIWSFTYSNDTVRQHHDFQVMPNGNVLVLAWERKTKEETLLAGRAPSLTPEEGVWFEHIVELQPIGLDSAEIVWEWHVFDHLVQERDPSLSNYAPVSESPGLFNINYKISNPFSPTDPGTSDWMHFNSIQYHEARDEILISSRSFNEVYIIDHSTTTEEAQSNTGGLKGRGGDILFRWGNDEAFNKGTEIDQKLFAQHHANWIDRTDAKNVSFVVFNNGQGRPSGDNSSVDFITPVFDDGHYKQIDGRFELESFKTIVDRPELDFTSLRLSSAQVFKDGNILITSGNNGAILELTPNEDIVWKYINPKNNFGTTNQGDQPRTNDVFRAERYDINFEGFKNKVLEPKETLEINLTPYECIIIEEMTNNEELIDEMQVEVYPNPVVDQLTIEPNNSKGLKVQLHTINGLLIYDCVVSATHNISLASYEKGIYLLTATYKHSSKTYKIIKQ